MLHPSQPQKRYPTQTIGVTAYFSSLGPASISFQDRCLRPLGHSSGSPPRTHLVVILKDVPRGQRVSKPVPRCWQMAFQTAPSPLSSSATKRRGGLYRSWSG
jgi:hypothetical protein